MLEEVLDEKLEKLKAGQGRTKISLFYFSMLAIIVPGSRKPYSELFPVCIDFFSFANKRNLFWGES